MWWFGGFEVAVRAPRHPRRGAQVGVVPPHDHGDRGDVAECAREGGEAGHLLHLDGHPVDEDTACAPAPSTGEAS